MEWLQYLSPIITAIGVIIMGWWKVTQKDRDYKADRKHQVEMQRLELRHKRRNDHSMSVYNSLHEVRIELDADRVYVVQPHPLGKESMLSVYYEVRKAGVSGIRETVQELPMSEVPAFCAHLHDNLFLDISDIDSLDDRYAKSLLATNGTKRVYIKRLSDNRHDWVGSIFVEFGREPELGEDEAKAVLHKAAMEIQYILPEIL